MKSFVPYLAAASAAWGRDLTKSSKRFEISCPRVRAAGIRSSLVLCLSQLVEGSSSAKLNPSASEGNRLMVF